MKEQIHQELTRILTEDCPLSNTKIIQTFAEIIIENVLL